MNLNKRLFTLLIAGFFGGNLPAGTVDFRVSASEVRAPAVDARFERNHFELSLVTGALFSPADLGNIFPRTRTNFDYTQSELRLGLMLNSPWEAGLLRGNFEALIGFGGGAVIHGPGTALANGDLFIRYNFIQPGAWIVPYGQFGMGLVASDVARDLSQRLIGGTVEFVLQTGVGFRFLLNPQWSLDLEGVYQHISNADTADPNVGVNAFGGLAGATYSF